jgi:hypothetical protein
LLTVASQYGIDCAALQKSTWYQPPKDGKTVRLATTPAEGSVRDGGIVADTEDAAMRLEALRRAVHACPADLKSRRELAQLLEDLGETAGALVHWNGILDCDCNNLQAWEGAARCRVKSLAKSHR